MFDSGAKSSEEQPRFDLIPHVALAAEAARWGAGAKFHGVNNWQRGKDDEAFQLDRLNHLINHITKWANGDRTDDHLAAVRCNAAMLIWFEDQRAAGG